MAVLSQITVINASNRLNVIIQRPAGNYRPGQFGYFSVAGRWELSSQSNIIAP
jgi:hypothetical protein